MNKKLEVILIGFLAILLVVSLILALDAGLRKTETNECYKWQKQVKEYTNFYLTEAENFQCEYLGIEVNAPIK